MGSVSDANDCEWVYVQYWGAVTRSSLLSHYTLSPYSGLKCAFDFPLPESFFFLLFSSQTLLERWQTH